VTIPGRPLHDRLVALAGTPDDDSRIAADLIVVAQLAASRIDAVTYASVTSRYEGAYATVAASDDVAVAVDEAQYADDAGPCLEALDAGYPAAVPDVAATMTWPRFRQAAAGFGLHSSLSIPLFAGSGEPVAALNLYSRDPSSMHALVTGVWSAYEQGAGSPPPVTGLDAGGRELVTGLAAAMGARDVLQQAFGVLIVTGDHSPHTAYVDLRLRAARAGITLMEAALRLLGQQPR